MERLNIANIFLSISFAVLTQPTHINCNLYTNRPLKAGDTFTPAEMLPVAIKLMQKVEAPGSGKGIVSASRNAADLADRLFEAFFLTSKRFVTIQEFDISGLDALQALALNGQVANNTYEESATVPRVEMYLRGQQIDVINEGRKCKYKLLSKRIDDSFNVKRRGIELAKKLGKKRRLVVKSRRSQQMKSKVPALEMPADIRAKEKYPEHKDTFQQFRKMDGLSLVDEEVEKILQYRGEYLRATNQDENETVESLAEYFNKIIISQSVNESTTATVTDNYVEAQSNESNDATGAVIESRNSQNSTDCDESSKTTRVLYRKRKF